MWACFFLMVIIISLCVVFCKRLTEIEATVADLTRRVNEISTAIWIDSCDGEDSENKVSQEQIEEAIKRAGL